MRFCSCEKPVPATNPRARGACVKCGRAISEEWTSNDETVRAWFDRLARSMFPAIDRSTIPMDPPEWFQAFRAECEARERAGRPIFGHEYLRRKNPVEAQEEAADAALYFFFDVLVARRNGDDEQVDLALTGAYHAAKMHEVAQQLRAKRQGSSGPAKVDE